MRPVRSAAATAALLAATCAAQAQQEAPAPRLALELAPAIGQQWSAGTARPLDLGLRWRQAVQGHAHVEHVDITAWQRMDGPPDAITLVRGSHEPVYGARVEMKISGRRAGFLADRGFLGLQLDNGARIMLRRKDGNPTLYYRAGF